MRMIASINSSESGKSILDTYLEDPKIERKVDLDVLEC